MANKKTSINKCTYNCKNIQSSIPEINDLCKCHDIVLLQETWVFRNQLPMLSSISNEFVGYGLSSMKDEQQIHTGRPFGGIAVLWRKSLNKYISIVTYDCDRIVGLKFELNSFGVLFVCVYLPYDCSDNFDDYMFLLAKISQIIDEFQTPYVYVCGDFNANGSFHVRSPKKKMIFETAPPQILIKLYTLPLCDYNRRPVILRLF